MSALEKLKAYVLVHYEDFPPAYMAAVMPRIEAEVQELYDAVAHELAEKIRNMDAGVIHMSGRRVSDIDVVADLIDPEVP
ncbi:hypothetical protein B5180_01750 [Streptomyces sp. BF-3]|nr:hypothetical protein B5180_01750 [Streptomyces sp. BF-3]